MAQRLVTVGGVEHCGVLALELVETLNRVFGVGTANVLDGTESTVEFCYTTETQFFISGYLAGALHTEARWLEAEENAQSWLE
jgi:hypothetical protein